MKIVSEDKVVENKSVDLLNEWEKAKPVEGNMKPDAATKTLTIFEGKFSRLKEERENVSKAKEALELAEPGMYLLDDHCCVTYYIHVNVREINLFDLFCVRYDESK